MSHPVDQAENAERRSTFESMASAHTRGSDRDGKFGGSDGTRTRGRLRDRRSNQLNYAPAYGALLLPDCSLPVPPFPTCVRNCPRLP